MIPQQNLDLWNRIQQFELDVPNVSFPFSKRLARENGWTHEYALKVIEEYKKFIFLCCISPTPITPSDEVDQAWHLHLTYTQSYWIDFCQNTLQKHIHHNPTEGGNQEALKFDNYYSKSLQFYQEIFDTLPPQNIWRSHQERFGKQQFQRLDTNNYWLIHKNSFFRVIKPLFLSGLVIGCFLMFVRASGSSIFWVISGIVGLLIATVIASQQSISTNHEEKAKEDSGCGATIFTDTGDTGHSGDGGHGGDGGNGCSGCGSGCSGCSGGCSGCGS
ncbi:MAG: hypothetical protein ACOVQ4_19040 [Flectobacillus sp.]|uniref:glycine-rich domain-containing protein n=1 Tax=Flectobacillus sp. TaxID=50419 RepID=UPI003B9B3E22